MNTSNEVVERRVPKCSKCRNHKMESATKGHKGKCNFQECNCPKCQITEERRAVMRSHVKIRRQLEKEEKRQQLLQLSAGPSTQVVNNPIVVTTLPSIHSTFGQLYSFGSQSTISELSQQSWGSMTSVSDPKATEDNYSDKQ